MQCIILPSIGQWYGHGLIHDTSWYTIPSAVNKQWQVEDLIRSISVSNATHKLQVIQICIRAA